MPVKVRRPFVILVEMSDVIVRESFDRTLATYFPCSYKQFLFDNWQSESVKKYVKDLVQVGDNDPEFEGHFDSVGPNPDKGVLDQLAAYIEYCIRSSKPWPAQLLELRYHVWFDGYAKGQLQTPIYSTAYEQLLAWNQQGVRLILVSTNGGWDTAMRRFISRTSLNNSNLTDLFADVYDEQTVGGSWNLKATYDRILQQKLHMPAETVLFITRSAHAARAAKETTMDVVIQLNTAFRAQEAKKILDYMQVPIARTLAEIEFN